MKIAIDYRLAASSKRGMARYTREIVHAIVKEHPEHEWILFINRNSGVGEPLQDLKRVWVYTLSCSNYIWSEQIQIYQAMLATKAEVLWCPYNTFPLWRPAHTRLVVTIHDLIFLDRPRTKPSWTQRIGAWYRSYVLRHGWHKVDAFLTVSRFSKRDMIRRIGIPSEQITVGYNCVGTFAKGLMRMTGRGYKREDFYFTVSGDAPSKNLPFLLAYFSQHPEKQLVVAGVTTDSPIRENAPSNVRFLPGGVSDETLMKHYLTCKAFVFASLAEGFGLPVVEAMAAGCPLILSDRTSVPEIGGSLGIYFRPLSISSLEKAMQRLENWSDNKEQRKKQLARFMDWNDTAKRVYRVLINENSK